MNFEIISVFSENYVIFRIEKLLFLRVAYFQNLDHTIDKRLVLIVFPVPKIIICSNSHHRSIKYHRFDIFLKFFYSEFILLKFV